MKKMAGNKFFALCFLCIFAVSFARSTREAPPQSETLSSILDSFFKNIEETELGKQFKKNLDSMGEHLKPENFKEFVNTLGEKVNEIKNMDEVKKISSALENVAQSVKANAEEVELVVKDVAQKAYDDITKPKTK